MARSGWFIGAHPDNAPESDGLKMDDPSLRLSPRFVPHGAREDRIGGDGEMRWFIGANPDNAPEADGVKVDCPSLRLSPRFVPHGARE